MKQTWTEMDVRDAVVDYVRYWSDKTELKVEKLVNWIGIGRVFDNIFVERLWRTVKVEEVHLRNYQTVAEARLSLGRYFTFYNHERLHQALGYRTPAEVYGVATGPLVRWGHPPCQQRLTR